MVARLMLSLSVTLLLYLLETLTFLSSRSVNLTEVMNCLSYAHFSVAFFSAARL